MSAVDEDVLLARAYLMRVAEPPAPGLAHLVRLLGPMEAAERLRSGVDLGPHVGAEVGSRRELDRAGSDLEAVRALGGRLLVPEDDDWPLAAMAGFDAAEGTGEWTTPLGLWVRGPVPLAGQVTAAHRSVAMVGSRAATGYGKWVARDWAASFADPRAGGGLRSGARDRRGGPPGLPRRRRDHRGRAGLRGRARLPRGPRPAARGDRLPRARGERVPGRRGAGAAPVPRPQPPDRGPGHGTLLVEAGARSGAARTANAARALGRPVLVVPGPVTSAMSVGNHALARDGWSTVVGSVADVLSDLGPVGGETGEAADAPPRPTSPFDGLSTAAVRVHGALRTHTPQGPGVLARDSGVPPRAVDAALEELLAAGLVTGDGSRGVAGRLTTAPCDERLQSATTVTVARSPRTVTDTGVAMLDGPPVGLESRCR